MSDKILNRLEIIGRDDQVQSVRKFINGKPANDGSERFMDFNKIVKMSDELGVDITRSGDLAQLLLFGEGDLKGVISFEEAQAEFRELNSNDRINGMGFSLRYHYNEKAFGHRTWETWCYENWGTKWNAWEQVSVSKNVLIFTTANFDVHGLIEKLSSRFPKIEFKYSWDDGSEDKNCIIRKGEIKSSNFDIEKFKNTPRVPPELAFKKAFQKQGYKYESRFIDG